MSVIDRGAKTDARQRRALQKTNTQGVPLRNGQVTSSKLADGAVTTSKLADEAVTSPKLDTAAAGTAGQVLTRTAGGMDWEDPPAGGGVAPDIGTIGVATGGGLIGGEGSPSGDYVTMLRNKIGTFTIPADTLQVGTTYRFRVSGLSTNTSGSNITTQWRLTVGNAQLLQDFAFSHTQNPFIWVMEMVIVCAAISGTNATLRFDGTMIRPHQDSPTASAFLATWQGIDRTVNHTEENEIELMFRFSGGGDNRTMRPRLATLEKLFAGVGQTVATATGTVLIEDSTDEASLLTGLSGPFTIPADTLQVGTTYRLRVSSRSTNTSGANRTGFWNVKVGSTDLISAFEFATTQFPFIWIIDMLITCVEVDGSDATLRFDGVLYRAHQGSPGNSVMLATYQGSDEIVDLTADQEIDVTFAWGFAHSGLTMTGRLGLLEKLYG